MHREEMLKMLHEIDAELTQPLEIGIAGASALVLNGSISRTTSDLDIYKANPDITQFQGIIDKLALKYHLDNNWIDTRVSDMISKYLPGYEVDFQRVDGDFKFLQPYIISKVDSVITKLMSYESIRSWDKKDLKTMTFSYADYEQLLKKLDKFRDIDQERILNIEIEFKMLRPEFIKTADGFPYSNSNEVAEYSQRRYGIELEEKYLEQLDNDAQNIGTKAYLKAILDVDYKALEKMAKGN